jgi:hypothetical protein
MALGVIWADGLWNEAIWDAPIWEQEDGGPVDTTQNLDTLFLEDAEPVPASARFLGGAAYAQTGELYIAAWPADNVVFYIAGFAYRPDGALCIHTGGTEYADLRGISVTSRGETRTTLDAPDIYHNGLPLTYDGKLCVTEQT